MNDPVPPLGESDGTRLPALRPTSSTDTTASREVAVYTAEPTDNLSSLATTINAAHEEVGIHAQGAITGAIRAGEALLRAKAAVPHGSFKDWVQANCRCSYRSARRYMQVAGIARDKLADLGHFEGGVSALLTAHARSTSTETATSSAVTSAEVEPEEIDRSPASGSAENRFQQTATAVQAPLWSTDPLPIRLEAIDPPELGTLDGVETLLKRAMHIEEITLDIADPATFKARERMIDQLSDLDPDQLRSLLASVLLMVAVSRQQTA